jgi:hypothetical protein
VCGGQSGDRTGRRTSINRQSLSVSARYARLRRAFDRHRLLVSARRARLRRAFDRH